MTAKELFEELGYACQKNDVAIIYSKHLSTCINEIVFRLDFEKYVAIEPLGGLFIDADILTDVSGRDVPIATIVIPIINDGTFNIFAAEEAPSTKKSAPFTRSTNPTIKMTIALITVATILFLLL